MPTGSHAVYSVDAGSAVLYSAGSLNTLRETGRTRRRPPETARNARDMPRLYALYSVVFRCRMHTNSASQPYSRKGFQFCIQCIQRIPTPPVFCFFPLLEPEYMNTANTIGPSPGVRAWTNRDGKGSARGVSGRYRGRIVFSGLREYMRTGGPVDVSNAGNGANRARHALLVCIVFSVFSVFRPLLFSPSSSF